MFFVVVGRGVEDASIERVCAFGPSDLLVMQQSGPMPIALVKQSVPKLGLIKHLALDPKRDFGPRPCCVRAEAVGRAPGLALLSVHTQLCFVKRRLETD